MYIVTGEVSEGLLSESDFFLGVCMCLLGILKRYLQKFPSKCNRQQLERAIMALLLDGCTDTEKKKKEEERRNELSSNNILYDDAHGTRS